VKEYWKFDRALQASDGKPVRLTVKRADGKSEDVQVVPQFSRSFNSETISFAGWCRGEHRHRDGRFAGARQAVAR
jgi:hypothetical protein